MRRKEGDRGGPSPRPRGLFACGDDGTKVWQLRKQGRDVGRLYHLEEFVEGVVLQATDSRRSVEKREAFFLAEGNNLVDLESLGLEVHKMVLVAKEYLSLDTPVVVYKIRIVKVHAPPFSLGRKTA